MTSQPQDAPTPQDTIDPFVAAAAEAKGGRFVEAWGNRYDLPDEVGAMAVMDFAYYARQGVDSDTAEGLSVMREFLEAVFTEESWEQFRKDAKKARAGNTELFEIVGRAMAIINGFPTTQPSPSSAGLSSTTPSSTGLSFAERKRAMGMVPVTPESLAELAG